MDGLVMSLKGTKKDKNKITLYMLYCYMIPVGGLSFAVCEKRGGLYV